jgi:hypothetical protein
VTAGSPPPPPSGGGLPQPNPGLGAVLAQIYKLRKVQPPDGAVIELHEDGSRWALSVWKLSDGEEQG